MGERVGLLGGSFDPPHVGHVAIARAARERVGLDRVLFAPTGLQPFKKGGAEASWADRMRMVELLCAGDAGWEASAVDGPRADGAPNYTVDALETLRLEMPGARLFGVIGVDSLREFGRWRRAERLVELAEWIVVSRPGFARVEPPTGARVHWVDGVAVPVASHVLRERLRAGESCAGEIPGAVLRYIGERGLYGARGKIAGEGGGG